jgi:hypothetical protein
LRSQMKWISPTGLQGVAPITAAAPPPSANTVDKPSSVSVGPLTTPPRN